MREFDPWLIVGVFLMALLVIAGAHIAYPRRDWRPVSDGHAVIMYDRWTGRFQRAEWDKTGRVTLTDVYTAP